MTTNLVVTAVADLIESDDLKDIGSEILQSRGHALFARL
jgi:hypothetical protein